MRENRPIAIAIAGIIVVFAGALGGLLIVLSWIGVTGYSVFKMITGGTDDEPNAAGILIGVVLLVTTLTLLMAVGIRSLGKMMEPPKLSERGAF